MFHLPNVETSGRIGEPAAEEGCRGARRPHRRTQSCRSGSGQGWEGKLEGWPRPCGHVDRPGRVAEDPRWPLKCQSWVVAGWNVAAWWQLGPHEAF